MPEATDNKTSGQSRFQTGTAQASDSRGTTLTEASEGAAGKNREYYETLTQGRNDYWRKMAGPRFRASTFLELIDEYAPRQVADLGCGNGQLLLELRRRNPLLELCGIDLAHAQIEVNRDRMPEMKWYTLDLDSQVVCPSELAARFDVVIASEIVEHLDYPDVFLTNAHALAKPSCGLLFLSTQSGPLRETERRVGHQRHFTSKEMEKLLQRAGWEPIRVWNCGFPFHDLSKWIANLGPNTSMRRFGEKPYGIFENLMCLGLRFAFRFNSQRRGAQLFAVARARSK